MTTYTIYHCPTLTKCGCTEDFERRQKDTDYKGHSLYPLNIMEDATPKEAGDEEWWWADYYQYKRGRHYTSRFARPHLDVSKEKISLAQLGRKHGPMSEEQKEKLRLVNLGRKHTEEAKEKIRLANFSRKYSPMSEEAKEKIRLAQLGIKRGPFTEEHKEKMRKPKSDEHKEKLKLAWIKRKERKNAEISTMD